MIDPRELSDYGIQDIKEIVYNPSYNILFAEETKPCLYNYEKGIITKNGAVSIDTGINRDSTVFCNNSFLIIVKAGLCLFGKQDIIRWIIYNLLDILNAIIR